jgi:hypothetical protein
LKKKNQKNFCSWRTLVLASSSRGVTPNGEGSASGTGRESFLLLFYKKEALKPFS